jgi:hypothetical protein
MRDYEGIKADINRMAGPNFREWWGRFFEVSQNGQQDTGAVIELSGELVEAIVVEWPFEAEISQAGYAGLGVLDMDAVDFALEQEIALVLKKKSERLSISQESTPAS